MVRIKSFSFLICVFLYSMQLNDSNPLYIYLEDPNNFNTFLQFFDDMQTFILSEFKASVKGNSKDGINRYARVYAVKEYYM